MASTSGPFATQYVQGIYIPCGLLIFGTFIVKKEWLPYAVALAALLGSYKVWVNRTSDVAC
jgi:cytochrome-b5 reductase